MRLIAALSVGDDIVRLLKIVEPNADLCTHNRLLGVLGADAAFYEHRSHHPHVSVKSLACIQRQAGWRVGEKLQFRRVARDIDATCPSAIAGTTKRPASSVVTIAFPPASKWATSPPLPRVDCQRARPTSEKES